MTNVQAHRILLERYKTRGMKSDSAGSWSGLREDGYIHEHLCWHLEKAGEFEQVVALLQEETVDGRNAWYEVREGLAQTGGYITDLLRAWELTRERSREYVERGKPIATLALEMRFLFMLTSLNSMAASIPGVLMGYLVQDGVWRPEVALAHCSRITDSSNRSEALLHVVLALAGTGRTEQALTIVLEVAASDKVEHSVTSRTLCRAIRGIMPFVTEEQRARLLLVTLEIDNATSCLWALEAFVPYLTTQHWLNALAHVRAQADDLRRVQLFMGILPYLILKPEVESGKELGKESGKESGKKSEKKSEKEESKEGLEAERDRILLEALACARSMGDAADRVRALTLVGEQSPSLEMRQQVLQEALVAVRTVMNLDKYLFQFSCIIGAMLESRERHDALEELLFAGREIDEATNFGFILSKVVGYLTPEQVTRAFARMESVSQRSHALEVLIPYLTDSQLDEAMVSVRELDDSRSNDGPQVALVATLAARGDIGRSLAFLADLPRSRRRAQALDKIASLLTVEQIEEILLREQARDDEKEMDALKRCLYHLAARGRTDQALAASRRIEDQSQRANALTEILPALSDLDEQAQVLSEALRLIRKPDNRIFHTVAGCTIAKQLIKWGKPEQALEVALEIEDSRRRLWQVLEVVPYLRTVEERIPVLGELLAEVRKIEDSLQRASGLRLIAPQLTGQTLQTLLSMALEAMRATSPSAYYTLAFAELTHTFAQRGEGDRALALASELKEEDRVLALQGIVAHLSSAGIATALSLARQFKSDLLRIRTLAHIVTECPPSSLPVPTHPVPDLSESDRRDSLLAEILSGLLQVRVEELRDWATIGSILSDIAPLLTEAMGRTDQAIAIARRIETAYPRSQALKALALSRPSIETGAPILQEALVAVRSIADAIARGAALVALLPHVVAPEERERIVAEGLAVVEELLSGAHDNYYETRKWMRAIASGLVAAGQGERMLEIAIALERDTRRAAALAKIAPYVNPDLHEQMLAEIHGIDNTQAVHGAMQTLLAEMITRCSLERARQLLDDPRHACWREYLRGVLVPHLAATGRVDAALSLAREMVSPADRCRALAQILPYLNGEGLQERFLPTISEALSLLQWGSEDIVNDIAPHLIPLSGNEFYPLWESLTLSLALLERSDLFGDYPDSGDFCDENEFLSGSLVALMPLLQHHGGEGAIEQTQLAIRDVTRWWA